MLLTDGTLEAWGQNLYGKLGDGTTTNRLSPVVVKGLSGVTSIEAGRDDSFAITSDGLLHAWGLNSSGQLGDGTTTNRLTPVTIPGLSGVTEVAAGYDYATALVSGTPDTTPPTVPGTPSAVSSSPGTVSVSWAASTDDRATTITYSVFRDGGSVPIGTVSSSSTGTVSFTDSGLVGGSSHTYQVSASDGTNSSALSAASNPVTVQTGQAAVFSDDFSNGLTGWQSLNMTVDSTKFPPDGSRPAFTGCRAMRRSGPRTRCRRRTRRCACKREVDLTSLSTTGPLLRLRAGTAGVARLIVTLGRKIGVRADGSGQTFASTTSLPLGAWHTIKLCSSVGTSATMTGWLDGQQLLTATSSTGTAAINGVQLGSTTAETMSVNYDNIVVTNN